MPADSEPSKFATTKTMHLVRSRKRIRDENGVEVVQPSLGRRHFILRDTVGGLFKKVL